MIARILDRLLGHKCPLCRRRIPNDVTYCPSHYPAEVAQHQEMNR